MRVALSGTPGTGKTSVATVLMNQGYTVVQLHTLAQENHCIAGVDKKRNSQLIDMEKLDKAIQKNYTTDALVFFDGHIAHLLTTMDKVILLRCHPKELEKRLQKKNGTRKKSGKTLMRKPLMSSFVKRLNVIVLKIFLRLILRKNPLKKSRQSSSGLRRKNFNRQRHIVLVRLIGPKRSLPRIVIRSRYGFR